jgi:ribose transport system substrate-binding protein
MQRIIACTLAVCCFAVLPSSTGCNKPSEPAAAPSAPEHKRFTKSTIGVSLASLEGSWRTQMKADIEAAAAEHPDLGLVIYDAQNDPAKQQAQLEDLVATGAKAIIVSPQDAQALAEPLAKAFEAGTAVVVLDRAPIGGKYSCFIAADPKQIGAAAGKWLAKRLAGKGKIVEIKGPFNSLPAQELHDTFRAELRDPGYRFVFEGFVDPPKVDAARLMGEGLGQVKQIDAVFAYDDAAAYMARQIAKDAGRQKGVLFIGVGGLPAEGAAYVKEGILDATVLFPTGGAEAVDAAVKLLHGETPPRTIVPATRVMTK